MSTTATLGNTDAAGNRSITLSQTNAWVRNTKPRPSKAQIIETLTDIYPKFYTAETTPPLSGDNDIAYYVFGWLFTRAELVERYDLQELESGDWSTLYDAALGAINGKWFTKENMDFWRCARPERRTYNDPEIEPQDGNELLVIYFATNSTNGLMRPFHKKDVVAKATDIISNGKPGLKEPMWIRRCGILENLAFRD